MAIEGGCYCGALRYKIEADVMFRGQCHCRECQYIAGGGANLYVGVPTDAFRYVEGSPRKFKRSDLDGAVTREFCGECGTHLVTHAPGVPATIVKVGSLDDPSLFGTPQLATFTAEMPSYHHVPEGCRAFERLPG